MSRTVEKFCLTAVEDGLLTVQQCVFLKAMCPGRMALPHFVHMIEALHITPEHFMLEELMRRTLALQPDAA